MFGNKLLLRATRQGKDCEKFLFFLRVCLLCDAAMSEDCTWRLWRQEKVERKVWLSSCFVVKVLGVRALAFRVYQFSSPGTLLIRVLGLCESRGGRPGLPVPDVLSVQSLWT